MIMFMFILFTVAILAQVYLEFVRILGTTNVSSLSQCE